MGQGAIRKIIIFLLSFKAPVRQVALIYPPPARLVRHRPVSGHWPKMQKHISAF
jgi:hypothetical protein